jgi:phospholipase C
MRLRNRRLRIRGTRRAGVGAALAATSVAVLGLPGLGGVAGATTPTASTPIDHVVVIFQENVSFDHYFGTYPVAANSDGQSFTAKAGTPAVDGLKPATDPSIPVGMQHAADLTATNPNSSLPVRLSSNVNPLSTNPGSAAGLLTCDQDHNYADEQKAFDGGAMDKFVQTVGTASGKNPSGQPCTAAQVMDYYDGNTVPALWNYAQNFAMSDNSFGTTFGPSAPGAINLVSGDTGNVDMTHTANNPSKATALAPNADLTADGNGGFSLTSDAQPYYDDCSTRDAVALSGTNVGDELNSAGLSWGWFQGGFKPTTSFATATAAVSPGQSTGTFTPDEFSGAFAGKVTPTGASNQALCNAVHPVGVAAGGTGGTSGSGTPGSYGFKDDYIAHHEPFQYYASTANPHHLTIPTNGSGQDTLAGLQEIGTDTQSSTSGQPNFDTPNHQYDTSDFDQLVSGIAQGQLPAGALPAVSFLKAPGYQDGHAAYSDPADEQAFVTKEINALEQTPDWAHTAVIVSYDDSDGFYDHVYSGVTNPSSSVADQLTGTGACGTGTPLASEQGRCGFGPRLPLLVISPYAKSNFVDHTQSDQSSITKFIQDNWSLPGIAGSTATGAGSLNSMFDFSGPSAGSNPVLYLDPVTGAATNSPQPLLPEFPYPGVAVGFFLLVMGGGALVVTRRRRRLSS